VWQRFLEANKETMWPLYAAPGRTPEEWACSLYFTKGGGGTAPVSVAGKINDMNDNKGKGGSDGSSTKFSTSSTMTRTGRASRSMKVVEEKKVSGGGGGDKDNKEKDYSKDKDNKNNGTVASDGPSVTIKSGAGKGGKGHLKKAQESSSTDDKCVSSESLSLSSRSQEGEEERRNMQRKADSNGSPSDDAMLTGGSDSPPISTSEGKKRKRGEGRESGRGEGGKEGTLGIDKLQVEIVDERKQTLSFSSSTSVMTNLDALTAIEVLTGSTGELQGATKSADAIRKASIISKGKIYETFKCIWDQYTHIILSSSADKASLESTSKNMPTIYEERKEEELVNLKTPIIDTSSSIKHTTYHACKHCNHGIVSIYRQAINAFHNDNNGMYKAWSFASKDFEQF
jgi:hypothetical protein